MRKKILGKLRPTTEDLLRAVGYFALLVWAVLFVVYPAKVFIRALDVSVLIVWMSITGLGAFTALVGALTRFDLKVEFPGLLVALVGPLFYSFCQLYFVLFPSTAGDNIDRTALVVYSLLPAILLFPRVVALYTESRRLKRINTKAQKWGK